MVREVIWQIRLKTIFRNWPIKGDDRTYNKSFHFHFYWFTYIKWIFYESLYNRCSNYFPILFSVDCKAGSYIDGNKCSPCGYSTYQPNRGQTSCLSCDSNKNTTFTGSDKKDNCKGKQRCFDIIKKKILTNKIYKQL